MKISGYHSINFGAKLISKPNIKQYEKEKHRYEDISASFVELDPTDKNDLKSVHNAVKYWEHDIYGINIANIMDIHSKDYEKYSYKKIYAITTQKKDVSKLNSDDIQALAYVCESKKRVKLVFLQVAPYLVYDCKVPDYKHVGKGMIDGLKDKYNDRAIVVVPATSAIKFYEKQGFENEETDEYRMIWNRQAEEDSEYKNEYL